MFIKIGRKIIQAGVKEGKKLLELGGAEKVAKSALSEHQIKNIIPYTGPKVTGKVAKGKGSISPRAMRMKVKEGKSHGRPDYSTQPLPRTPKTQKKTQEIAERLESGKAAEKRKKETGSYVGKSKDKKSTGDPTKNIPEDGYKPHIGKDDEFVKYQGRGYVLRSKKSGEESWYRFKKGGVVMKKAHGGKMSHVALSPAEESRSGTLSEAKRKKYAKTGGVVKRKAGGLIKKQRGGPFEQGYGDRKRESIAMRIPKHRTPEQLQAAANESYGRWGHDTGRGRINLADGGPIGDELVSFSYTGFEET
tara:strand:- start:565 stop:1479 length:915 start_codon:yes stop_codon:yes gene_type:complete